MSVDRSDSLFIKDMYRVNLKSAYKLLAEIEGTLRNHI